ncbi:MAG: aldehyde dehydrogenase family protein, partial [Chitinophagia bacterium]|nr:aldehyde dehydrogenase family protein [Chitinophagia bacterium]
MNNAHFFFPEPQNEPVRNYAPFSPEAVALHAAIKELKSTVRNIPMYINGEQVHANNTAEIRPPHERNHLLGTYSIADASHVQQAIDAALAARQQWADMPWEHRATIFLKAADLLAHKYRFRMNAATMLGQSKNAYQAEIDSACELIDFLRFNVHF